MWLSLEGTLLHLTLNDNDQLHGVLCLVCFIISLSYYFLSLICRCCWLCSSAVQSLTLRFLLLNRVSTLPWSDHCLSRHFLTFFKPSSIWVILCKWKYKKTREVNNYHPCRQITGISYRRVSHDVVTKETSAEVSSHFKNSMYIKFSTSTTRRHQSEESFARRDTSTELKIKGKVKLSIHQHEDMERQRLSSEKLLHHVVVHIFLSFPPALSLSLYIYIYIYILIPKTIGNRKRDCAWGGSGW